MAAVPFPSVVGAVRDGQALSSNSGYRNFKCDSFLSDIDAFSNYDFLESALYPPSACKWEELPWLKAKSFYSLAAFVAIKPELSFPAPALSLPGWLNSQVSSSEAPKFLPSHALSNRSRSRDKCKRSENTKVRVSMAPEANAGEAPTSAQLISGSEKQLSGPENGVESLYAPARYRDCAVIMAGALAAGYAAGTTSKRTRNAAFGGALALGVAGGDTVYALNSIAPRIAVAAQHIKNVKCGGPNSFFNREETESLLHKYGESKQKEALNAELRNPHERMRRQPFIGGTKEDADDMFDKIPLRDSSPNRGLFSVSAQTESAGKDYGSQRKTEISKPFQILIAHISGKSMLHWVRSSDLVQDLKLLMEKKTGIPTMYQRLLYEGKQLEDTCPLSSYNIQRNASITLSMRLRGGAAGECSSAAAFSYKDAVHSKKPKERAPPAPAPKPFVVDKSEDIPSIELAHPILDRHYQLYAENGIICRFNGLWPSTADLYQWIHANWTNNCKVLLCSKGFFITVFVDSDDYQRVLTKGPWFWNSAGLFLTPWFPEFDPSTAVITKLPIWVRLPNLPAHLWSFVVFEAIGNSLGRFLETDPSRGLKGIYTYARICAEIDISKGLPDQIILKICDFHWSQPLDYENTAFRCRYCHLTGHLQSSCPSMPFKKKKANSKPKDKSWKPHDPPPMDVFSSSDEEDVEEDVEVVEEMTEQVSPSARHEEAIVPPNAQKRTHESSPSDSDKELSPPVQNSLQIVLDQHGPNGWVKVGKKKGKKSRPSESTLGG